MTTAIESGELEKQGILTELGGVTNGFPGVSGFRILRGEARIGYSEKRMKGFIRKRRIIRRRRTKRRLLPEILTKWTGHRPTLVGTTLVGAVGCLGLIWWLAVVQTEHDRELAEQSVTVDTRVRDLFMLKDGDSVVRFRSDGVAFGLAELPTTDASKVITALRTLSLDPPLALANSRGGRDAALSMLLTPVATVVADQYPEFRWLQVPNALNYQVRVYDAQQNEVTVSPPLTGTTWRSLLPLEQEHVYNWNLRVQRQHDTLTIPQTPTARFQMAEQQIARRMERSLVVYRGRHLVLGVLYADSGFRDRAEEELQALLNDNPASGEAKKLLESVRAWR